MRSRPDVCCRVEWASGGAARALPAPLLAVAGLPSGVGEGAGWPVSLLNSLMGFGRACAPARSRRVAVGRVSAGLRLLAVSPWPLLLVYTLVD